MIKPGLDNYGSGSAVKAGLNQPPETLRKKRLFNPADSLYNSVYRQLQIQKVSDTPHPQNKQQKHSAKRL